MNGWLIVNSYIKLEKFLEIYNLLLLSAKKYDISLSLVTGSMIMDVETFREKGASLPDFAIFWDKDIFLAKRLESQGIRLFNSAKTIEICDSKILTYLFMRDHGIRIPKTYVSPKTFESVGRNNYDFLEIAKRDIGFPMIIKENFGSFGAQVYLVHSENEAKTIISSFGCKDFVMQEFIAESRGKDVRINVVGGEIITSIYRQNDKDFRSNVSNGAKATIYEPSEKQCQLALDVCKSLDVDFAGVDLLLEKDSVPILCEVNSNPAFKSTLDCTGINIADSIIKHIKSVMG